MTRHNHREATKIAKRNYWDKFGAAIEHRYNTSEKGRAYRSKIGAIRRAATEIATSLTADQWREILDLFDHRCSYCHRHDVKLEMDHYIPLAKGGQHTKENVVPACRSCNARKGSRLPH